MIYGTCKRCKDKKNISEHTAMCVDCEKQAEKERKENYGQTINE